MDSSSDDNTDLTRSRGTSGRAGKGYAHDETVESCALSALGDAAFTSATPADSSAVHTDEEADTEAIQGTITNAQLDALEKSKDVELVAKTLPPGWGCQLGD